MCREIPSIAPRTSIGAATVLLLVLSCSPGYADAAMTLTLESDALVVSSLSPGDTVALLSLSRQMFHSIVRSERRDEWLEDEDLDGEVRLPLESPAPEQSVWLAVNVTSGEWAMTVGAPETGGPLVVADAGDVFSGSAFSQAGTFFELLVVRPGTGPDAGAWGGALADGTALDADGELNRSIGVSPSALTAVGSSPTPPGDFQPGDIVAVVDPATLYFGVEQVQASRGGEGVTP